MIVLDTIERELIEMKCSIVGGMYANSAFAEGENGAEHLQEAVESVEEQFNDMVADLYDPQKREEIRHAEEEDIDWEGNQFFKSTKRQMEQAEISLKEYDPQFLKRADRRAGMGLN